MTTKPSAQQQESLNTYHKCLNLFVNHAYQACLDLVTQAISNSMNQHHEACLYRLWIELLCVPANKSKSSLKELQKHLFIRSIDDPENINFYALRGLIHFELNEIEAVNLIETVLGNHRNIYARELKQKLAIRQKIETPFFLKNSDVKRDYLVFTTHLQTLCANRKFKQLTKAVKLLKQTFPSDPSVHSYLTHIAIEEKDFKNAKLYAKKWVRTRKDPESLFTLGFAYMKCNQFDRASQQFESCNTMTKSKDIDTLGCLAFCYFQIANHNPQSQFWLKALQTYSKALHLSKKLGLPHTDFQVAIDFLKSPQKPKQEMLTDQEPQYWLVNLSPRRFVEMVTQKESEIEYLHQPIHRSVGPNDIVLFMGDSVRDHSKSLLVAVYGASLKAVSHPIDRFHNPIELIVRLKKPIELQKDRMGARMVNKGVFTLSEQGLDYIIQEVNKLKTWGNQQVTLHKKQLRLG